MAENRLNCEFTEKGLRQKCDTPNELRLERLVFDMTATIEVAKLGAINWEIVVSSHCNGSRSRDPMCLATLQTDLTWLKTDITNVGTVIHCQHRLRCLVADQYLGEKSLQLIQSRIVQWKNQSHYPIRPDKNHIPFCFSNAEHFISIILNPIKAHLTHGLDH